MDRGRSQERPDPNPSTVDLRRNAVGPHPLGVRPMAIATLEEYLREFSVEIGDRILTSFPALHAPGDPVSPILGTLLRKPFAAQEVAIAGAAKRLIVYVHRPRSRSCVRTPVRLSFRRAASATSENFSRNSTDDPRRQDVCDRQPAVAAPRSMKSSEG